MKVLFTGGSSFTGYWFIRELAHAGHEVVALFRRRPEDYSGLRGERVTRLADACRRVFPCSFGEETCLGLIADEGPWDLLCHHAADASNYKSPDFNVVAALANNTRNLPAVLAALRAAGCGGILLTGSIFEPGEGAGSDGLPAFSPYGVSKRLTAECFRYHAAACDLRLGNFVISNPFGPYEEPRFTTYLVRTWLAGQTPTVNTPAYVRDNIHVSLLAREYVRYATAFSRKSGPDRCNPSGYVETQGAFARRFASELQPRLSVPCPLELRDQREFTEPRVRLNTDVPDAAALGWNEQQAWDELAAWYRASLA